MARATSSKKILLAERPNEPGQHMPAPKSIRRTAIQYGAVFSLVYFTLIFFSHAYVIKQLSDESRKQHLNKELGNFQAIIEAESPTTDDLSNMINQFEMLLGHAIVIETASGSVLASNNFDLSQMQGVVDKPEGFIHIAQGANTLFGLRRTFTATGKLASITVLETEGALSERPLKAHLTLLGASAVLLAILLALIGTTTHLTLKPISKIKEDLRRLQSGKQSRLNPHVPEEFRPLIRQLNDLLELSNRRLDRHRRLNSDLSHLVKTSISANLAILSDIDTLPPSREDVVFMASNLRELDKSLKYRMSKADISGRQMGRTCMPVEITASVITVMEKIFPDTVFRLHTNLPENFSWPMERQDLSELLGNLLENGGKWCQTTVDVTIARTSSGLSIEVADDGPGISPEAAATVMNRGTRLDETVAGFGLGLSIVSEIVEDNLGQMNMGTSKNGGASIVILLPLPD